MTPHMNHEWPKRMFSRKKDIARYISLTWSFQCVFPVYSQMQSSMHSRKSILMVAMNPINKSSKKIQSVCHFLFVSPRYPGLVKNEGNVIFS